MPANPKPRSTAPARQPVPQNGRGADKHRRILEAAIEVIAERGYFSARVSEIAARAGVADGTVYLYFKNKEQLLMAAIEFAFTGFLRAAKSELAGVQDARERLRRLASLHLDSLGANRPLAIVLQTELRQSAKFLGQFSEKHLKEYFDLIRSIIREGQQAGVLRKGLSDKIAANCFFGALDEIATTWVLSDGEYPLGQAAEAVVDVVLLGLETRNYG